MSAIKSKIVLNWTVEENYTYKENCKTDRKGCDIKCNASNTLLEQGGTKSLFDETKKCDALWMNPDRNTFGCVGNSICRRKNCSERWICLEKLFARSSKALAVLNNKENCAISSQNINGEQRTHSAPRNNQTKCQIQIEKTSLEQNSRNNRKKVKGHVISKQSSLAITPYSSIHNFILTHCILFGK